jgi:hypothetical protein
MCNTNPKTVFFAKTWYRYVGAIVATGLTLFGLVVGPLALFGIMKRVDGRPATDGGIALSILAILLSPVALLGWLNILAYRKPLLRICREGIELNVIGSSSLDGVLLVPPIIRIAWLVLSLQGFKRQIGWIPWSLLRGVEVRGMPMLQSMVIDATIVYPSVAGEQLTAKIGDSIAFGDAEFLEPLDEIVSAIRIFHANPQACESLPSLHD